MPDLRQVQQPYGWRANHLRPGCSPPTQNQNKNKTKQTPEKWLSSTNEESTVGRRYKKGEVRKQFIPISDSLIFHKSIEWQKTDS